MTDGWPQRPDAYDGSGKHWLHRRSQQRVTTYAYDRPVSIQIFIRCRRPTRRTQRRPAVTDELAVAANTVEVLLNTPDTPDLCSRTVSAFDRIT